MKRQSTGTEAELATDGTGGGGGTVDQGTGGASPWLIEIDASQLPLPVSASIDTTGLATDANQVLEIAELVDINTALAGTLAVAGPLTDAELRATPVPISGTVTANVTNPLPVTGPLTDTELRATPVPVSGTVAITAAALPLPSGAATLTEQQTQTTALQIIDDWDESDRAKVNLIVGSAGITGNAGNVAANTPRVTLAADDPAVAVLGVTTGAKVITDAAGTIQQYLRGLIYQSITAGAFLVTAALSAGTNIIGGIRQAGLQNASWYKNHFPAANTVATITQSAAGGSLKNVCLGFTVTLASSSTTAPAAIQVDVKITDDPAGTPVVLWGSVISLPAVAGAITSINRTGRWIGTANKDLKIAFSAAGGANTIESVTMEGTTE